MGLSDKQRSALRIALDILNAVQELHDAKPTHILNKANLSHDRLVRYVDRLLERNLIEAHQDGENRFYTLTPRGVQFLLEMRRAEDFVVGFGLSL